MGNTDMFVNEDTSKPENRVNLAPLLIEAAGLVP